MEGIRDFIPNIHKEGYFFIALFFLATCFFFFISTKLGYIGLLLTICCVLFFRDPERVTPLGDDLVVSPADGIITNIAKVDAPKELGMTIDTKVTRVSIFLSVLDVHVNRIPITGVVKKLHYHPGQFINASLDKASEHNERQLVLLENATGTQVGVVQIAGLIARRIICNLYVAEEVKAGERFGIIRFGSRVDLYLPESFAVQVLKGQYMIGGETVIAKLIKAKKAQKKEK